MEKWFLTPLLFVLPATHLAALSPWGMTAVDGEQERATRLAGFPSEEPLWPAVAARRLLTYLSAGSSPAGGTSRERLTAHRESK